VGLGWVLNAGGVITRQVMGRDDFTGAGYSNGSRMTCYFNNPALEVEEPPANMYLQAKTQLAVAGSRDRTIDFTQYILSEYAGRSYDFQPDVYSYNFNGHTGRFIFKRTGELVLEHQGLLKIEGSRGSAWTEDLREGDGAKWRVTTPDGFQYYFTEIETYKDAYNEFFSEEIITAWYLTKIVSPTNRTVEFFYKEQVNEGEKPISGFVEQRVGPSYCSLVRPEDFEFSYLPNRKYTRNLSLDYITFEHGKVVFNSNNDREGDLRNGVRLNSIDIFKKNLDGQFQANPHRRFIFQYSYFYGKQTTGYYTEYESDNQKLYNRLKLESLHEFSANRVENKVYEFEYYENDPDMDDYSAKYQLPAKDSYERDYWNYYNGKVLNNRQGDGEERVPTLIPRYRGYIFTPAGWIDAELDGADRSPDAEYAMAYSLKSIKYPTKGWTKFFYEGHDFNLEKSMQNDKSMWANSSFETETHEHTFSTITKGDDPDEIYETVTFSQANGFVLPGSRLARGQIRADFRFSDNLVEEMIGYDEEAVYFELWDLTADKSLGRFALANYQECFDNNANCSAGVDVDYETGAKTLNGTSPVFTKALDFLFHPDHSMIIRTKLNNEHIEDVQFVFEYETEIDRPTEENYLAAAGGLRISKIVDFDNVSGEFHWRKFQYNFPHDVDDDGADELVSSGVRRVRPMHNRYSREYRESTECDDWLECGQIDHRFEEKDFCYLFLRSNESNVGMSGANGVVVAYDSVSVLYGKDSEGEFGIVGKTTYKYENTADRVRNYLGMRIPGIPNLGSNRNGLLREQIDYRRLGDDFVKIHEIKHHYLPSELVETYYGFAVEFKLIDKDFLAPGTDVYRPLIYIYPSIQSSWIKLGSTEETTWDLSANTSIFTKVDYTYEETPRHYQVTKTERFQSNSTTEITTTTYPLDYPAGDNTLGAEYLRERFMHSIPLVETKYVQSGPEPGNSSELFMKETEFEERSGIVLPVKISSYPTGSSGDAIDVLLDYDDLGNIVSEQKQDDVETKYIWGYNQSRVLAKIEGDFNDQFDAAIKEVLQDLGYAADINSLNEIEDEDILISVFEQVRATVPGIFITSYTHDTSSGITTITDPNGLTVRYNYDEFGRLSNILDDDENMIKRLEYQYKIEE
jgi:YD repeat-containing protein